MIVRELTEAERLGMIERDLRDHSRVLTTLTEGIKTLDSRVLILEEAERTRRILEARQEEREKNTIIWRDSVDARFKALNSSASKLLWLIGGSVVAAFMAWILKGGLMP